MSDSEVSKPPISQAPPLDSLHPSRINLDDIKDKSEKEQAKEIINKWYDNFSKELHELFAKNHLDIYEICFYHPGAKAPMLICRGRTYHVARLASAAHHEMKGRLNEELDNPEKQITD